VVTAPLSPPPGGPNTFASSGVDRLSAVRRKRDELEALAADPRATVVLVRPPHILMVRGETAGPALIDLAEVEAGIEDLILLGVEDGVARWALDVGEGDGLDPGEQSRWATLTEAAARLSQRDGSLLAQAQGMVHWARRHRFCGQCGSPTTHRDGGYMRQCSNPDCGIEHFPRLDPAVIMLVTSGDRCLLGRQAVWPARMYSTLAGFVEPGESLEDAVAREVLEEVGVVIGRVVYHSSQPWPFPSSLMLGFEAEALSEEIVVDRTEIEDARWCERDELESLVADGGLILPGPMSIARRMVDGWLARA
jgi:NAD+ diphosphatase